MHDYKPAHVLMLRIEHKITFPSQQCLQLFSSSWTALCSHLRGWNALLRVLPSYSASLWNRWPSDIGNGSYTLISLPPAAHTSENIPFRTALPSSCCPSQVPGWRNVHLSRSSSSPPDPAVRHQRCALTPRAELPAPPGHDHRLTTGQRLTASAVS